MMRRKKMYLTVLTLTTVAMMGCTNSKKADGSNETTDTTQVIDVHNAENSLDYVGEYKGTIPAADCPGINVTLKLDKDRAYTLLYVYIEREGSDYHDSGTFETEGNILTLNSKDGNKSYYGIGEEGLTMLNADKEAVTGELAQHFVLRKQL